MSKSSRVWLPILALCIGGAIGQTMQQEPEKVIVTKTEVKTVNVPGPTKIITNTELSAACTQVIDAAVRMYFSSSDYDDETANVLDTISDTRIAITSRNFNALIRVERRMRNINSKMIDASSDLGEASLDYETNIAQCKEDQK